MASRRVLAAIGVALGAVGSIALWSMRPEVVLGPADDLAPRAARAPAAALDVRPSAVAPGVTAPSEREPAALEAVAETLAAPPPLAAPPGGLLVRVVGEDGAPLAGVPVAIAAVFDGARSASVVRAKTRAPDGLAALHADLRRKERPPGLGFSAALALPLEPRVARALDGWTPGEPWNGGTIELVLPASARAWLAPLAVEVVDARGKPVAGAEVEVHARRRLAGPDTDRLSVAQTRAPDGIAEVDREPWIEWIERARMMQVAFDLEARCAGPFRVEPSARIEPGDAPVRLALPPTGALAVRLADHEGRPVARDAEVGVAWYAPGADRWLDKRHVRAEQGGARFEHVGLGLDLAVWASLEGGAANTPTVRRAGPAREGELVEIVLAFGPEHPRVVGRLVDERGEPAPGMLFWLAGRPLEADAEGRFSVPWPATSPATAALRFEERSHPKLGAPKDWIPLWGEVPFPRPAGDGHYDAGDVALRAVPVVLEGRVLDADGAPVRQAWLLVQRTEDEDDPSAWRNLKIPGVSRASTREDGTFELRSLDPARSIRVSASRGKLASGTVVVAPGTRGVELVVAEGEDLARTRGRVDGRVRIEEHVPWHWIEAVLVDAKGRERDSIPFAGVLAITAVVPGTYRLELKTAETGWPLTAIDGVVVEAGAAAADTRLAEIDLVGKTRVWRARFEDPAGAPRAKLRLRVESSAGGGSVETDPDGRIAFLAPVALATIRFEADGHAPVDLAWSDDELPVVLE